MKLAILGTRGIPANYGGFETFAEELSKRLVARGHEVTVYCRSHHTRKEIKEVDGVRLRVLPTIRHKYFDTVFHTLISAFDAAMRGFDAVLICNAANSPFIPIMTWTGTPVAVNVDGLERKRRKWGRLGRTYYRLGERASYWFATRVVTDARVIRDYYRDEYDVESTFIAYGAEIARKPAPETVRRFGVEPEQYVLYLSRLEPENNAAMVIEAFKQIETDLKLLIVGDAPYAHYYKAKLKLLGNADNRIIFTGFVFGDEKKSLQQNAYVYIHATEVGGTHPALIEAMGAANCVLAYNTPENREVLGETGILYADPDDLAINLGKVINNTSLVTEYRHKAQIRARQEYDWETVTDRYEELFTTIRKKASQT